DAPNHIRGERRPRLPYRRPPGHGRDRIREAGAEVSGLLPDGGGPGRAGSPASPIPAEGSGASRLAARSLPGSPGGRRKASPGLRSSALERSEVHAGGRAGGSEAPTGKVLFGSPGAPGAPH